MLRLANPRNFAILQKTFAVATQQVTALNYKAITPIVSNQQWRSFSITSRALCESDPNAEDEAEEEETNEDDPNNENSVLYKKINRLWSKYRGTDRDRSRIISPEESIRYIKSSAFKLTYGDKLPWELYRRIHKGQFPKARTRRSCIRHNVIAVGSPCPVCRDEYLVLHHTNVDLLQMFVSPHTGKPLEPIKSGLCQRQNLRLLICLEEAYDLGLMEYDVPFRKFDYNDYYPDLKKFITKNH